ncbi:hypothetical protein K439DRAFT_1633745 [Ramaria rubella]|nr:hypothetical protein K439DRAFT_1633745 [Ramaria rubella]
MLNIVKFVREKRGAFLSSPQPREREHQDAHMTFSMSRGFSISKDLLYRLEYTHASQADVHRPSSFETEGRVRGCSR